MGVAGQPRPQDRLKGLEVDFAHMAAFVESQLADAVGALERRDVDVAERVIRADEKVDAAHKAIDSKVISLLQGGPHDPTAIREMIAVMKVAGDLERVGDMSKNIAKRSLVVSRGRPHKAGAGVARMGRASLRQMSDTLNAFSARNLSAARAVWGGDDDLDELYNSIFREILVSMMEDPAEVNSALHLVFIAKNFERVGDHATNIAEALHFLMTGSALAAERPKGDETSMTTVKGPQRE
jgi:phosphate transport system protein